jgi:spermidine/putrescine transport system ATP-binding protein
MQQELRIIHEQTGITFLAVTHDQEEALTMSDWVAVMNNGRLEHVGTPHDVFESPVNRFVAEFMGAENVIPVAISQQQGDRARVPLAGGELFAWAAKELSSGFLVIRPKAMHLALPGEPAWEAEVLATTYRGSDVRVRLQLNDGTRLTGHFPSSQIDEFRSGAQVGLLFDTAQLSVVPGA